MTPATLALVYADQEVGTNSLAKGVTFNNGGNAAFSVDDITVSPNFKVSGGSCAVGGTVAPGSSCSVTVQFAPTTTGAKTGTLTVSTDGAVNTINLSGTGLAPADTVAPTAPGTPRAVAAGANGMTVSWTASTDNVGVVRYNVYRDGATALTGTSTTTSFSDTDLLEASSHTYVIRAVDAAALLSPASATATGRTADVTAPPEPTVNPATGT